MGIEYRIDVAGPSTGLLVDWLMSQGWVISYFAQTSFMKGYILGSHESPEYYVRSGISDGTYISKIEPYNG